MVFKHNFNAAITLVLSVAIALHYKSISSCPMIVAYGSSETGKTTALRIAMSLIGIHDSIYMN